MKLATKLSLAFLVMAGAYAVIGLVTVKRLEVGTLRAVSAGLESETTQAMTSIEASIAASIANLQTFSRHERIAQFMQASNAVFDARTDRDAYIQAVDTEWKSGRAETTVQQTLQGDPAAMLLRYQAAYLDNQNQPRFAEVYITNKYGVIIASTARTSDYLQADEAWYQAAISAKSPWLGGVEYDQSSRTLSVDFVLPLFDATGAYLGCIKGVYSIAGVYRTLNHLLLRSQYKTTNAYLVSETGKAIFSSLDKVYQGTQADPSIEDFGSDLSTRPAVAKALEVTSGTTTFATDEGVDVLAAFTQTSGTYLKNAPHWHLVVEHDVEEVLAPLRQTMAYWTATSAAIAVLLLLALARLSYLFVSRPIARLATAAVKVGEGDFDVEVEPHVTNDEIGTLTQNFAVMAAKLSSYRATQATHNQELQVQADALQQANDELAKTNKLLEEASRAKSEFVANMSHEIRTPISVIISYIELLMARAPNEELANHAKTIHRNARHLLQLVGQVLDLAKVEAGKLDVELTPYGVRKMIDEVETMMRERIQAKGLSLAIEFKGEIPDAVMMDPTRLREVLINLVENAMKFTERGGIILTTSADDALVFEVADTGPGISAEGLKSLFAPFTQLDASASRRAGGTGLGLAISRRLAVALGGDLTVQSSVGFGSRFTVTLPLQRATRQDAAPAAGDARDALILARVKAKRTRADAPRFLVAEDEPDINWLMNFWLSEAGADVVCVTDGAKAIEAVREANRLGTPFQTILMDMQMPGTDGYTAAKKVRELGFRGRLIAATAHAMKGDAERCLASGCDEYLAKPLSQKTVLGLVQQATEVGAAAAVPKAG